jgi:3-deoxy-D-manno-octulosonic-acid transferase
MNRPRARRLDWWRYRLALAALAPAIVLYTLWKGLRYRDLRYVRERLGLAAPGAAELWLHAASVGEVNAALPLLRGLLQRYGTGRLLVTTNTPTGARALARQLPAVAHGYLPVDWRFAVDRFLAGARPRLALIMETELWPALYAGCAARGVPPIVVNGRLSPRTLRTAAWLRRLYAEALGGCAAVLARAECDRAGFLRLGAAPDRCETVGNIKFAAAAAGPIAPVVLGRPYVVAASTREGEETPLLQAWRQTARGDRVLVIVPRHPERLPAIRRRLDAAGARYSVRSRGEAVDAATEVYLADTFGELAGFYAGADAVFVGGSLVPKGGQNLIEPAALGRPVVVGPHMENFQAETRLLLQAEAVRQVGSPAALAATLSELLAEPAAAAALGLRARAAVAAEADVAERYLSAIEARFGGAAQAAGLGWVPVGIERRPTE